MNIDNSSAGIPPFLPGYRASGLLLHVASLPSPYGIGDVGPATFQWIDRLHEAGQTWWQALPLGPEGGGDLPYQSSSSFAANELLISPDHLIEDGLLQEGDCGGCQFPEEYIDYGAVIPFKQRLLETAWANFSAGARPDLTPAYEQFRHEQSHWLEDYALFRALKASFHGAHYLEWPAALAGRNSVALDEARCELAGKIGQVCFAQFLLFRRSRELKEYANAKGVRLIGDLPFFVAPDSSEVWAHPEFFLLDETLRPRFVAGVPPNRHSSQGDLWGNPVYNWEQLRQTGFRWCIDRLRAVLAHVDVVRLDHFRGFAGAWHVPAHAPTAQCGHWVAGPGAAFFAAVQQEIGALPLVAEDLGMITADVGKLLHHIEAPGTRVLQLAFDGHSDNPHLPDNYDANTVVYTGTHDGPTTRAWYEDLPALERRNLWGYLRRNGEAADAAPSLIRLAWSSDAALAMAPLQDVLNLGGDAGRNVAAQAGGSWRWRATEEMLRSRAFEWLRELTTRTNRQGVPGTPRSMRAAS